MKKWIGFIVMFAFIVTTMPYISHADTIHTNKSVTMKSEQTLASSHKDCPGHDNAEKPAVKKSISDKPCCDGKTCKCVGGLCNGLAKAFGLSGSVVFLPLFAKTLFTFEQQVAVSDFPSQIKRPPRA